MAGKDSKYPVSLKCPVANKSCSLRLHRKSLVTCNIC